MQDGRGLTVGEEHPAGDEQDDNGGLSEWYFWNGCCVENICPVLRREDLVDREERIVQRPKVDELPSLNVAANQLHGEEGSEQVDLDQEQGHVGQTVHVPEDCELYCGGQYPSNKLEMRHVPVEASSWESPGLRGRTASAGKSLTMDKTSNRG